MDLALIPVFVAIGCLIGFIAGLLGIGGGLTMIPLLVLIFSYEQFPADEILHIAVATSMATIVFTSIASVRAHNKHRAVLWPVFWKLAPGILIGSLAGPQIVSGMSTRLLSGIFALFTLYTATRLLLNKLPKPSRELPGAFELLLVGSGIGVLSSMVGAGGGFVSVPFMTACNVRIQNAVATSAALGLPIAAAGTVGFLIAGFRHPGLPPYTVGYIYLPALAAIVSASMLIAPIGVRLAHRWPVARLRHAFAGLMYVIAAFFFWKLIKG
ncbi:MAG: sulfite exporter TauE/SafE family protein [Pseudomonadota bacterium]|nr:sulfite exporter TauE/SafE family protein [Pseudomonadota bacterium]